MGWDSDWSWRSKADVIAASIREYSMVEHSVVGNHLWGVVDTTLDGKIVVLILIVAQVMGGYSLGGADRKETSFFDWLKGQG
jgi:hypothetical protein